MRNYFRAALTLIIAASPAAAQTPAAVRPAGIDSMALARKWTKWFYDGSVDSLVAAHEAGARTPELKQSLERNYLQLTSIGGAEVGVVEEKFVKRNGNTQYWRTANFTEFKAEPLMLRWAVNKNWEIIGIGLNPASQAPPIDKP